MEKLYIPIAEVTENDLIRINSFPTDLQREVNEETLEAAEALLEDLPNYTNFTKDLLTSQTKIHGLFDVHSGTIDELPVFDSETARESYLQRQYQHAARLKHMISEQLKEDFSNKTGGPNRSREKQLSKRVTSQLSGKRYENSKVQTAAKGIEQVPRKRRKQTHSARTDHSTGEECGDLFHCDDNLSISNNVDPNHNHIHHHFHSHNCGTDPMSKQGKCHNHNHNHNHKCPNCPTNNTAAPYVNQDSYAMYNRSGSSMFGQNPIINPGNRLGPLNTNYNQQAGDFSNSNYTDHGYQNNTLNGANYNSVHSSNQFIDSHISSRSARTGLGQPPSVPTVMDQRSNNQHFSSNGNGTNVGTQQWPIQQPQAYLETNIGGLRRGPPPLIHSNYLDSMANCHSETNLGASTHNPYKLT